MAGLDDYQWQTVLKTLDKIDDLHEIVNKTQTDVELLNAAIRGNGAKGIKDQISEILEDVKKKVNQSDCAKLHSGLEIRKKSVVDWVKVGSGWVIAIIFGILAYIK